MRSFPSGLRKLVRHIVTTLSNFSLITPSKREADDSATSSPVEPAEASSWIPALPPKRPRTKLLGRSGQQWPDQGIAIGAADWQT